MDLSFDLSGMNPISDAASAIAEWMNDRPPGAAAGWEEWIPLYGNLKNAIAYFADGRWGWGALYSAMAIADAFLVAKVATTVGRLALGGARSLMARATAEITAESFAARKAGWRYISRDGGILAGNPGATDLWTGEAYIAEDLVGTDVVETVRHELVHQRLTPNNPALRVVRILGYNFTNTLRVGEEFACELYGTGRIMHSLGFSVRYASLKRLIGDAILVGRVGVGTYNAYLAMHGIAPDVIESVYNENE